MSEKMSIKEFNEKLKENRDAYDLAVVEKIKIERELTKAKFELATKIMELTEKIKQLRYDRSKMVQEYYQGKVHPKVVSRLRSQFSRKRDKLMEGKPYECNYCKTSGSLVKLTAHHIISLVDGGDNTPENLVWACKDCHDAEEGREPPKTEITDETTKNGSKE